MPRKSVSAHDLAACSYLEAFGGAFTRFELKLHLLRLGQRILRRKSAPGNWGCGMNAGPSLRGIERGLELPSFPYSLDVPPELAGTLTSGATGFAAAPA